MDCTEHALQRESGTGQTRDKAKYCYVCRREHPPEHPMRRIETRGGPRWRCEASLEFARLDPATRDALGRQRTAENRLMARRAMELFNMRRALPDLP